MAEGNGRNWSADIKSLGDQIVALTLGKAVELGDYMEQVHGIKAAAGGVAVMPQAQAATQVEAPVVKTEFTALDGTKLAVTCTKGDDGKYLVTDAKVE